MFVRRLYYDATGAMLHSYMMAGSITVSPADEVAAGLGLANYAYMDRPDQWPDVATNLWELVAGGNGQ